MISYMSNYIIYELKNFEKHEFNDFHQLKSFFEDRSEQKYCIFDEQGNEYKRDNIGNLEALNNQQVVKAVAYLQNDLKQTIMPSKIDNFEKKEENEKDVEIILNNYISAKKKKLKESYEICLEIKNKCEKFKVNEKLLKKFEESDIAIQMGEIIGMIKCSSQQIKNLAENYIKKFSDIQENYKKVEKDLDIEDFKVNTLNNDYISKNESKEKVYHESRQVIKLKISLIAEQPEIYNIENELNQLLITAEQINFYINLNQIPDIYEKCKPNLEKELQRRCVFKRMYEKVMESVDSIITEEFERRKKFFKENCIIDSKLKMQKKTIELLNQIFDFEEQKYKEKLDNLKDSGDQIFDKNIIENLKQLEQSLCSFEEIYKKKKVNLSGLNKLNDIINKDESNCNIINDNTNKIIENKNESDDLNNKKMVSSVSFPNDKNMNDKEEQEKIKKEFAEKYSKFIWFYQQSCKYLNIFKQQSPKKYNTNLDTSDPYTMNNFLVEVLNENKMLRAKFTSIKDLIEKLK